MTLKQQTDFVKRIQVGLQNEYFKQRHEEREAAADATKDDVGKLTHVIESLQALSALREALVSVMDRMDA